MQRKLILFLHCFFSLIYLSAKELTQPLFHIQLQVEKESVVAILEAPSVFWVSEVLKLSLPPPPMNWPQDLQVASAHVLDQGLVLQIDKTSLKRNSLICRYIEEPFHLKPSVVQLRATYDRPVGGQVLSGQCDFTFLKRISAGDHLSSQIVFVGANNPPLYLSHENPFFEVPISAVVKTETAYFYEKFVFFSWGLLSTLHFPIAVLLVFLSFQKFQTSEKVLFVALFIVFIGAISFMGPRANQSPSDQLGWILLGSFALFITCVSVSGRRHFFSTVLWWGFYSAGSYFNSPFDGVFEKRTLVLAFVMCVLILFMGYGAFSFIYRRRLKYRFGDVAARLYQIDERALNGFALFVSIMKIFRYQFLGK